MAASARNAIVPLLAAVVGITLAIAVRDLVTGLETKVTTSEFGIDAQGVRGTVQEQLATAEETVLALRAFYAGSDEVSEVEFASFTRDIRAKHQEIEVFAWAEQTDRDSSAYRVKFVEPPNSAMLGKDLAIARGRTSGATRANSDARFFAAKPVAQSILVWTRAKTWSGKQDGIVAARIDIPRMVERVMLRFTRKDLDITIVDSTGDEPNVLYGELRSETPDSLYTVRVADRELDVYVHAGPGYFERQITAAPLIVMLAILGATALAVGYVWVLQNRTRRIELLVEERTSRIREVTRFQKAILESAEYAIFVFDTGGTVMAFNPAAERMLQYRVGDVVSRKSAEVFFDPAVLRDRAAAEGLDSGHALLLSHAGGGVTDPWIFRRSDGTTFAGSLSVSVLHGEGDQVSGYLAIAQDITKRLEADEALRAAKAQAEDASRTKSRFLANMSHELRTPLTAILGYAEMLEEDAEEAGSTESQRDLNRIQEAGHHLLRLIDDVLDLSKVEAGRMELQPESIELSTLMEDVATTVRPLAESRGNVVEVQSGEGVITADPMRLRQVLLNLAANAARFTENGTIVLEAERDDDGVVFRVRDTGVGMSEDQLERIFAPFEQADGSVASKHGGTGLGLAIAREFTELMGGVLEVESKPGAGSEFTVRLPETSA